MPAIVTVFPTVTEEIETGTVPEMDAVTEPICAVPAPSVTEPAIVCVPVGFAVTVPAIVTVLPTVTVPEMGRVTYPLGSTGEYAPIISVSPD